METSYSPDNPFVQKQYSPDNPFAPKTPINKEVDEPGFFSTLGDYARTMFNLAKSPYVWDTSNPFSSDAQEKKRQNIIAIGARLGHNLAQFGQDMSEFITDPVGGAYKEFNKLQSLGKSATPSSILSAPLNLAKGGILTMASIPVTIALSTTNTQVGSDGSIIPATPEEEAKNLQSMLGLVAASGVASKMSSLLEPSSAELLGIKSVTAPGTLIKAAYGPRIVTGAITGGTYGGVSSMGQEDQLGQTISGALAGAAIGMLIRPSKVARGLSKGIAKAKTSLSEANQLTASDIASTRGLQISPEDSPLSMASKVKAYAVSENAIEAHINSELTMGRQFVLEGIPSETVDKIIQKYTPTVRSSEGPYTPSPETQAKLDRYKFNVPKDKNTVVDITDPFDKSALASEDDPKILDELKSQTGLSEDEIGSHRTYVKKQINDLAKDKSNLVPSPTPQAKFNYIPSKNTIPGEAPFRVSIFDAKTGEPLNHFPMPTIEAAEKAASNMQADDLRISAKQFAQPAIDKGNALFNTAKDGSTFTDAMGKQWIKTGRYITDGTQQLPFNDQTAELIGTDKKINPNSANLRVPKQDFNPEFGRELQGGVTTYKGANNTTLVSSYKIAPEVETFFKNSGFLPDEMVAGPDGSVYSIVEPVGEGKLQTKVKSLATGEVTPIFNQFLRRMPNGVNSEFYKQSSGETITRTGVYNKDTYYDNIYKKFTDTHFKLDEVPKEPFGSLVYKFGKSIGMSNPDDIDNMSSAFFSRIVNDVVGKMEPDIQDRYSRAVETMNKWNKDTQANTASSLHQALTQNNMSLFPRGGGVYDIKDAVSGKVMNTSPITDLDEALKFVNKSRQAVAYDLDGGSSNGLPVIGGTMTDTYVPHSTKIAKLIDTKFNAGAPATTLVRTRSAVNAMDEVSGYNFTPHRVAADYGQNMVHNFIANPAFRRMNDAMNKAITLGKSMFLDRKALIENTLTRDNQGDLITRFGLDKAAQSEAKQIASIGSGKVQDFINDVRELSNYNQTNTQSYRQALATITKNGRYDQPVIDAGTNWLQNLDGTAKPAVVLRLAQAIEREGLPIPKLSGDEATFRDSLKDAHDSIPGTTDGSWTYLPHAKLARMAGYNPYPGHSGDLIHAFARLSSSAASGQIEIDPTTILYNFRMAMIKSAKIIDEDKAYLQTGRPGVKISLNDIIRTGQDYLNTLNVHLGDDDLTEEVKTRNKGYQDYFQHYLDNVRGVPDITEQMAKTSEQALKEMYGPKYQKLPEFTRLSQSLVYASLLGFRPAFALRDIWTAHKNVFDFAGPEAAIKSFGGAFSLKNAKDLMDTGQIPATKGADFVNPGENLIDGMSRLSKIQITADNLSTAATKLNGQQLAHVQANTGIYSYYFGKVGELSAQMLKGEKSKADAYSELKIQKISPTEQKFFDDLISAGKTDQAGQFLGRTMVDRFNVNYGRNNAPQAWKSWFGKLAGGFGQWATNQINTNVDNFTRGTGRQIAESWVRSAISNSAIYAVGAYTGLNLSHWMINPLTIPGESPLLSGLLGTHQDGENVTNLDPAIANPALNKLLSVASLKYTKDTGWGYSGSMAHMYLPFSYFIQSEIDAAKMMQGDFGFTAGAKALTGISTVNSTVSPLQDMMGNRPEWNDKLVGHKGMGNQALDAMTGSFMPWSPQR